jgi:cyanophycinase-like exopeptidase
MRRDDGFPTVVMDARSRDEHQDTILVAGDAGDPARNRPARQRPGRRAGFCRARTPAMPN